MSELPWAAEAVDQNEAEPHSGHEPGTLALSLDDFSSLEDRILRAVNLVKRERSARLAAEERAALAEGKAGQQTSEVEQLQKEVASLRAERDHIRQRVEKLLSQLDALEL
jgi:hypothetical protein